VVVIAENGPRGHRVVTSARRASPGRPVDHRSHRARSLRPSVLEEVPVSVHRE